MNGTKIQIPMPDGVADAYVARPAGPGPWPAVIFFMDAIGWRPALFQMADRLASAGYHVLLPNMFWRSGDFPPFEAKNVFADPGERARLMAIMGAMTDENAMRDVGVFLEFLAARPEVADGARQVACTGYCMGGGLALLAACTYPDRIAAAASFHGGRLVTSPDGPALIAKQLKARVYIGVAETDQHHTPAVTERLTAAFETANVPFTIEVYAGAAHGFAVPDTPAYNAAAAEQHWDRLVKMLRETFV